MDSIRSLAIHFYEDLQPNASLQTIEERIWMLKQRNAPDGLIRDILHEEFVEHGMSKPTPEPDDSIVVQYLPREYRRTDWR